MFVTWRLGLDKTLPVFMKQLKFNSIDIIITNRRITLLKEDRNDKQNNAFPNMLSGYDF